MPAANSRIGIELYGLARMRAGRAEFLSEAATIRDALADLVRSCPKLANLLTPEGQLSPFYLLSVNAGPFSNELNRPLQAGDRLLLLCADAGG
jgi:molybdopterin converting factor small subunit